jgi:peptidyl-tRNA hydrolase
MSMAYTPNEMMTVAAARALRNEDVCFVGIGAPSANPVERKERTISHVLGRFQALEQPILGEVLAEVGAADRAAARNSRKF